MSSPVKALFALTELVYGRAILARKKVAMQFLHSNHQVKPVILNFLYSQCIDYNVLGLFQMNVHPLFEGSPNCSNFRFCHLFVSPYFLSFFPASPPTIISYHNEHLNSHYYSCLSTEFTAQCSLNPLIYIIVPLIQL